MESRSPPLRLHQRSLSNPSPSPLPPSQDHYTDPSMPRTARQNLSQSIDAGQSTNPFKSSAPPRLHFRNLSDVSQPPKNPFEGPSDQDARGLEFFENVYDPNIPRNSYEGWEAPRTAPRPPSPTFGNDCGPGRKDASQMSPIDPIDFTRRLTDDSDDWPTPVELGTAHTRRQPRYSAGAAAVTGRPRRLDFFRHSKSPTLRAGSREPSITAAALGDDYSQWEKRRDFGAGPSARDSAFGYTDSRPFYDDSGYRASASNAAAHANGMGRGRICGVRRRVLGAWLCLALLVTALAVGIGVGVGVGTHADHHEGQQDAGASETASSSASTVSSIPVGNTDLLVATSTKMGGALGSKSVFPASSSSSVALAAVSEDNTSSASTGTTRSASAPPATTMATSTTPGPAPAVDSSAAAASSSEASISSSSPFTQSSPTAPSVAPAVPEGINAANSPVSAAAATSTLTIKTSLSFSIPANAEPLSAGATASSDVAIPSVPLQRSPSASARASESTRADETVPSDPDTSTPPGASRPAVATVASLTSSDTSAISSEKQPDGSTLVEPGKPDETTSQTETESSSTGNTGSNVQSSGTESAAHHGTASTFDSNAQPIPGSDVAAHTDPSTDSSSVVVHDSKEILT